MPLVPGAMGWSYGDPHMLEPKRSMMTLISVMATGCSLSVDQNTETCAGRSKWLAPCI